MICMSRRSWRRARLSSVVTFWLPNHTSPAVGSIRRRMQRPVVDLPHPDSPTSPRVSPSMMSKDTSSTAWTRATSREKRPPRMGKYFLRFLTRSSGVSAMGRSPYRLAGAKPNSIQPAGYLVPGFDFLEHRVLLGTHRLHEGTARREAASRSDLASKRRHRAGDGLEPP